MKLKVVFLVFLSVSISGCFLNKKGGGSKSRATGWEYNSKDNGNVPNLSGYEQPTGPGLVFIEGGTFTMGRVEQDVMYSWDNRPRRVTVASFYMDETEVSNQEYRDYLYWISKVYPGDRKKMNEALPDTASWRKQLAYNEPFVTNYFRHPSYSDYPVVAVSWLQAEAYCKWRSDRVNEKLLVDKGVLQYDVDNQKGKNVFTTDTYITGLYTGVEGKKPLENADGTARRVRWEDGVVLPSYRLPTEAEWEYAAYGLIGNSEGELLTDRKIYPWNGAYLRDSKNKTKGRMKANFVRGRGDMMGMAGALNDNADVAAPVMSYEPNDYGLYCMSGNVNEWVMDVYRPQSFNDVDEFQPFRGNIITEEKRDSSGRYMSNKYGELMRDTISDYRNFKDGDFNSQIIEGNNWNEAAKRNTDGMYIQDARPGFFSSLINDEVRVYKGGSWKDRPYWLVPGTRRYLEQTKSRNDLGFRCVMDRVGSPKGL